MWRIPPHTLSLTYTFPLICNFSPPILLLNNKFFSPNMESLITLENIPDLISGYIQKYNLSQIDYELLIARIRDGLTPEMSSFALSRYCSEVAAAMITHHTDYDRLAAAILMEYHTAVTLPTFSEKIIFIQKHNKNLNERLYEMVVNHSKVYDAMMDYSRDFDFSYFAMNTLFRSYVLRVEGQIIERPQDVFMRIAIQIHEDNFDRVKETYDLFSKGYYTHSTPTMFNSMSIKPQLASCFLVAPKADSISGIFETLRDCALISKFSGGIGLSLHDIRSLGSKVRSNGNHSKGIVPVARIFNEMIKYVNLAGRRRQSSIAVYLEPWHRDIFSFLDLRKNTGSEDLRTRDIFTAIWMNDLFMERVKENKEWTLFDPSEAPGLSEVWGEEFKSLYLKYEKTISGNKKVVPAQELWKAIIVSQIETGTPYMVYKDTSNRLSNQQHLGTIKCSNLCTEIIEYTSESETAVCNLASICLPKFVENNAFNFEKLRSVTRTATINLNRIIDTTFYPTEEARRSNERHRPIGIGVQGLANVFAMLRHPYDSPFARRLNAMIFETIYFAAMEASVELAKLDGPYESFQGSPLSHGKFHFEMAGAKPSGLWDWEALRQKVLKYGARNSLLVAPMPTAATSQINGNNECFEPFTSNLYTRRTLAGEFQVVNSYLMADLIKLGLWSEEMRQLIIECEGSIQDIPGIPKEIKELYKIVWEIKMKSVIDMAADRQPYIDQSQSLNIYLQQPTYSQVSSMHFYGWQKGLKTGMYYLRTKPISSPIKFSVNLETVSKALSSLQDFEKSQENAENNTSGCEGCSC